MNLRPLHNYVIIKADEAETTTPSGLILTDAAKEKPQRGEVLAVGAGKLNDKGERIPVDISVGDIVLFAKYSGTEIKIEGQTYLMITSDGVFAVVD
jgi:chaperonin GroES